MLSRLSKAVEVATSSLDEEVGTYLSGAPCETTTDPLQWWKTNEMSFPHLAMFAKRYLAVPATSTKSERAYSAAGIIAGKRRASLLSENVDRLLFLNKNTDFGLPMTEEEDPVEPELPELPSLDLSCTLEQ